MDLKELELKNHDIVLKIGVIEIDEKDFNDLEEPFLWNSNEEENYRTQICDGKTTTKVDETSKIQNLYIEKVNNLFESSYNTIQRTTFDDDDIDNESQLSAGFNTLKGGKIFCASDLEPIKITKFYFCNTKDFPSVKLVVKNGKTNSVESEIPLQNGSVIQFFGPLREYLNYKIVKDDENQDIKELIEWTFHEDKLKCSEAYSKRGGRIQVRTLKNCLDRYKAELEYGFFEEGKKLTKYDNLLDNFWQELIKLSKTEDRIELGCWCFDEPNKPANSLPKEPSCHTQVILNFMSSKLKEKIPDNVFIINVKKDALAKRGFSPEGWNDKKGNFYLGYRMPFLPYQNHPLRNIYKVCEVTQLKKRKSPPKKKSSPAKKQKIVNEED